MPAPGHVAGEPLADVAPAEPENGACLHGIGTPAEWSRLSHELRTPLNAIVGNVELLLSGAAGPLSADVRTCLGEVQTASRHLMEEVQRMLLLAQVLISRAPAPEVAVDLTDLLARAAWARPCVREPVLEPAPAAESPVAQPLVVRGDPVWLEVLAGELASMSRMAADGARPQLRRRCSTEPRQLRLDLSWPGFDLNQLSSVALLLVDAILFLHGGHLERQMNGLSLVWRDAETVRG